MPQEYAHYCRPQKRALISAYKSYTCDRGHRCSLLLVSLSLLEQRIIVVLTNRKSHALESFDLVSDRFAIESESPEYVSES